MTTIRHGGSHRITVRDESIFIFDHSGETPEATEDGPLEIQKDGIVTIGIGNNHFCARIPVTCTRTGQWAAVSTTPDVLRTVLKFCPAMKVLPSPTLSDTLEILHDNGYLNLSEGHFLKSGILTPRDA